MAFSLTFSTDTDAIRDEDGNVDLQAVYDTIRLVAAQVQNGATSGNVRDHNGNTIGNFELTVDA